MSNDTSVTSPIPATREQAAEISDLLGDKPDSNPLVRTGSTPQELVLDLEDNGPATPPTVAPIVVSTTPPDDDRLAEIAQLVGTPCIVATWKGSKNEGRWFTSIFDDDGSNELTPRQQNLLLKQLALHILRRRRQLRVAQKGREIKATLSLPNSQSK